MNNKRGLVEKFLEAKYAEEGLSENSILAYSRDLEKISDKSDKPLLEITQQELEKYFVYLEKLGHSQSTRARHLSSIKQFFKFCIEEGYLSTDPSSQLSGPKSPKQLPKTLTLEEVDALLHVVKTHGKTKFEKARNRCLMELLYASGMRISELMSLPVATVRGKPHMILIRGKGSKERLVPLSPPALDALDLWLKFRDRKENLSIKEGSQKSNFLFPSNSKNGYLTRNWFFNKIKSWAVEAGIKSERVSPHTIRHAFATHLLSNGADLRVIQTLLGHSDITTTEIYTHIVNDKLKSTIDEHHPLSTKSK
jgi:integrase/recombinase XerD